jgi:LmbE family N-acetylglucosaminyl deacetylase
MSVKPQFHPMFSIFLAFLLFTGSFTVLPRANAQGFDDLAAKSAMPDTHILLFAPHPDDEVIGLGGWVFDHLRNGATASIVFLTDGEAYPRAARLKARKPRIILQPRDYRRLGKTRRIEGIRAAAELGVPESRVFCLGFPTNRLRDLALIPATGPQAGQLIRSRATRHRFGIARWAGQRQAPHAFSREALDRFLDRLLTETQPTTVIIPHPEDTNRDHQGTAALVGAALRRLAMQPRIKAYLVHQTSRRNFPKPFGYDPTQTIADPEGLPVPQRHTVSPAALVAKERAMRAHRTQIRLRDGFLLSFIRREEIFWILDPEQLAVLPGGN